MAFGGLYFLCTGTPSGWIVRDATRRPHGIRKPDRHVGLEISAATIIGRSKPTRILCPPTRATSPRTIGLGCLHHCALATGNPRILGGSRSNLSLFLIRYYLDLTFLVQLDVLSLERCKSKVSFERIDE